MEPLLEAPNTEGRIVFRFPRDRVPCTELMEGFAPLRLHMRPGSVCIELHEPGLLIGRHSGADVRLSLPDISRQHCRFLFADGQWEVLDLNSLNGIYVNGERLQRSVLFHGDTLRIASISFDVNIPGQEMILRQDESAAVLQRIADAMPVPDATQDYRKAS